MSLERFSILVAMTIATLAGSAQASFHLWDIVEVFSSEDGSIQYVELFTDTDDQHIASTQNRRLESENDTLIFGTDLPNNQTAGKSLLIGTSGYAALSGVPAPDFTIDNGFVETLEDTLQLLEQSATPVIDRFVFGFEDDLPLDGINSLNQDYADDRVCNIPTGVCTVAFNSPTNFNGESGVITVRGDANNDAQVTGADLIAVQQNFGAIGPDDGLLPGDANDDGQATGADLIIVQQTFGNTLTSTATAPAPLPEPLSLGTLVALGALCGGRGRRR
jgi:hypothetical protein